MKTISVASIRALENEQQPGWLDRLARRIVRGRLAAIRQGEIKIIENGQEQTFGRRADEFPESAVIKVHSPAFYSDIAFGGSVGSGEAYMEGTLTIEDGSLYDFLALVGMNRVHKCPHPLSRVTLIIDRMLRRFHQFNPIKKSQKNVAHHYDLSGKFYELFLDTDRQYSCAYYQTAWKVSISLKRRKNATSRQN